jgi:type 1 glutamine amidotransferase
MIDKAGWESLIETDLDTALARLPDAGLLAVNALYWSMTQSEKYALLREQWARALEPNQMDYMESFVAAGGKLLVLHTSTICWDTEPRWRRLIGGGWEWGVSHHPPCGPVTIDLTTAGANLSEGPAHFDLVDEAYHNLSPAADCTVLANADLGYGPQPLAWIREFGRGKVAVDALGHDSRSLEQPGHTALIRGQLKWLSE